MNVEHEMAQLFDLHGNTSSEAQHVQDKLAASATSAILRDLRTCFPKLHGVSSSYTFHRRLHG